MTIAPERLAPPVEAPSIPPTHPPAPGEAGTSELPLRLGAVAVSAALASAGAAWLGASLINGIMPRLIALLGVAIGAGISYLALRLDRPAVQYAILPVAAVAGTALTAPEAPGGTANLPSLVIEAIHNGGLLQPPIAFDPGWRFILVVLFAVVPTAAISATVATQRAKLAVLLPLPLIVGAALLQPDGQALVASMIAVFFLIGSLAVAFGAAAPSEDTRDLNRTFEGRRLMRGGAMLAIVLASIVGISQTDFLFPRSKPVRVIPPRRPPDVPMEQDRELFVAHAHRRGPFRIGVLDGYDGQAWLLPAEDPARIVDLTDGHLPTSLVPAGLRTMDPAAVRLSITDMRGLFLPVPSGLVAITGADETVRFDPHTGVPRLERRLPQGFEYTALSTGLPLARQLDAAPDPPPSVQDAFTELPPAPPAVVRLLNSAPSGRFSRVQFLRTKLYSSVVLSGGGGPQPISAQRVAQMLDDGTLASPYEVTAAEAMLARWAGVPSRIGYGYYGGDALEDGFSFRPKHGRVWLETYFDGYGWIPLVGTPPRAASSLSEGAKLQDPNVRASDDLAMVVFVPVRERSLRQLFEIVRYWFIVALTIALAIAAVAMLYPMVLKGLRASRRRRWGAAHAPLGPALVAYAEFRDRCSDLNLGATHYSPLVFAERFAADAEHDELAWLITRLFWGDLRRDMRIDDIDAALAMTASVRRRIVRAQSPTNRLLAATSRTSLREPFNADIPNFYPRPIARLRRASGTIGPVRLLRRSRRVATASLLLLLASCASGAGLGEARAPVSFPPNLPPERVLGVRFVREPVAEKEYAKAGTAALVAEGRVYSIHEATSIQGDLQVAVFKPDVDATSPHVREQVESAIGGRFQTDRFGTVKLRYAVRGEQRLYLWFPPERNAMLLVVLRTEYAQPEELVRRIVASVRGLDPQQLLSLRELGVSR